MGPTAAIPKKRPSNRPRHCPARMGISPRIATSKLSICDTAVRKSLFFSIRILYHPENPFLPRQKGKLNTQICQLRTFRPAGIYSHPVFFRGHNIVGIHLGFQPDKSVKIFLLINIMVIKPTKSDHLYTQRLQGLAKQFGIPDAGESDHPLFV